MNEFVRMTGFDKTINLFGLCTMLLWNAIDNTV